VHRWPRGHRQRRTAIGDGGGECHEPVRRRQRRRLDGCLGLLFSKLMLFYLGAALVITLLPAHIL
jgi:hypothetical protein